MKYFITGGCGFIGSHIAEELISKGDEVVIYDNLSTGYKHNIEHINGNCSFIQGDIQDLPLMSEAMKGADYVFHEAAMVSVFESIERPEDNNSINVTGTLNVLLAARKNNVKRAVLASSAAVYGNDPALPKQEDMLPVPESPYAMSKIAGEHYMRVFAMLYNVETVVLRYFNVFGPRQDSSSMYSGVISKFYETLLNKTSPIIYGDGRQSRDFVFVKDVVRANLMAMESDKVGKGEVLNIATGKAKNLLDLLDTLNQVLATDIKPIHKKVRSGDIRHSLASADKAKALLGWEPEYSFEKGLSELIRQSGK